MNPLHLLAYHHDFSGGTVDWLMHAVVSSFIHAMIYGVVFRLLHHLTMMQGVVLLVVVLGVAFMWARSRVRPGGEHGPTPKLVRVIGNAIRGLSVGISEAAEIGLLLRRRHSRHAWANPPRRILPI